MGWVLGVQAVRWTANQSGRKVRQLQHEALCKGLIFNKLTQKLLQNHHNTGRWNVFTIHTMRKTDIDRIFNFLLRKEPINDFESWIYNDADLESKIGGEFYFELINLST